MYRGSDPYNSMQCHKYTHTQGVLGGVGIWEDRGVIPVGSGRVPFNPRI